MKFRAERVTVVHPGVHPRYSPGGEKSHVPLVAAVGRLVPVKRFEILVDALVELRRAHPTLEAVIAGDGYKRDELEAQIHAAGADDWSQLPGRISDEDIVDLYRRAWGVARPPTRGGGGEGP